MNSASSHKLSRGSRNVIKNIKVPCHQLYEEKYCGKFTVLDDNVVISALKFNREVCDEFTVLDDVVVTVPSVTAI